jgi:hypothetical protein
MKTGTTATSESNKKREVAALGVETLKKSMRNPDSFKLTSVFIVKATGATYYEFRSQNGFGE